MKSTKKLTEEEIDKKIEAIVSLQSDWRWKPFAEAIQYYQGFQTERLFGDKFMKLVPNEKDKQHYAIVQVLNALNFVLDLPNWLERRKVSRWQDVVTTIGKDIQNARR